MALPGSAQPSPHVVGAAFVQQYYSILHKSPDQVHRFYQDSSILSRSDSDGMMTSVTTIQAINEKVLSMDFSEYIAEIESADSQASYKDGVLVVVTGSLTGRDNIRRKFTQSFFLAPQEGGYFVLNDIFRFIDLSQPSGANQVIVNGTIGDVSAAALTPEPEPTRVQEPQMATSVEHETSHTVEDIDKSEEIVKPTENDPPEGSIVVAAEEICMSEGLVRRKMKFLRFLRKRMNRKPTHGPIHFRAPAKILWRTIRGMIPHKTKRGAAALARLKAYEGVPPPYDKKRMVIPNALTVLRLQAGHKYCLLGKLSSQVVWGYYGTVKELELKRKQRAKVAYERKKQLSKLRLKAEKTAEEKL